MDKKLEKKTILKNLEYLEIYQFYNYKYPLFKLKIHEDFLKITSYIILKKIFVR